MSAARLPPEVNRILFVKNLPFMTTGDEIYALFSSYGTIRQVRLGNSKQTKGSAFVVFEDILDAKNALESMKGFKAGDRYMTVLYYSAGRHEQRINSAAVAAVVNGDDDVGVDLRQSQGGRKARLNI